MQDEPGEGSAMLGIDDQSEQQTGNEPGRDPGFFESQRSRAFRRREKGGGLRLGERVPGGAELGRVGAYGARFAAAIYGDRKSTRLNSSHLVISYAVFCLKKSYVLNSAASCPEPLAVLRTMVLTVIGAAAGYRLILFFNGSPAPDNFPPSPRALLSLI